jgi:hypothetical protein
MALPKFYNVSQFMDDGGGGDDDNSSHIGNCIP